ncbi:MULTISPECIES: MFS transporter [Azospirillum]|nr:MULTISPECIES: MFS transporter [Azospirillum]GLR77390.1 MFS transporter [Azospirillum oryzae]
MSLRSIPSSVVALGFVSLFMDVSSEMIHSLLPVFLVSVLGASALSVGFIEGIAEATASITKIFSGVVSDWVGRRKPLLLLGYGMAALTKPVFPLADTLGSVLLARFLDRIGKGVRGAPRDALVAEVTPPDLRGAAFGLRQSMDTVGAFAGPALAMLLMVLSGDDFRLVFWIAVVPAFIAVAVILFAVHEPDREPSSEPRRFPIRRDQLRRLDATFWGVVAMAAVLTLARFSEAFLLLRAQSVGVEDAYAPLVLIVMNVVYAVSAYPLGRLADRLDRRNLLALGVGLLVLADLVLAAAGSVLVVLAGAALWGLHMGATQGLLAVFVADATPADLRGTGFGLYNLMTGIALLASSALAGLLWTAVGPDATFLAGATFSLVALVGLLTILPRRKRL